MFTQPIDKFLSTARFVTFTELSCLEYQLTTYKVKLGVERHDGMMQGETEVSGKGINLQNVSRWAPVLCGKSSASHIVTSGGYPKRMSGCLS
jgi:hypothetical protein